MLKLQSQAGSMGTNCAEGRKPGRDRLFMTLVLQTGHFLRCFWNFNLGCAHGTLLLFGEG